MSITIVGGEIKRNGARITTPITSSSQPVSLLFGVNPTAIGDDAIPLLVNSDGSLAVSQGGLPAANLTYEYVYSNNMVSTEKIYSTGASAGSPAKLITYTYNGNFLIKKEISDTTV